jgi:hypothetical protein
MTLSTLGRPGPLESRTVGTLVCLGILWVIGWVHLVPGVGKAHIPTPRVLRHRDVQVFVITYLRRVKVKLVALQTDKRFILLEEIVGDGPVGGMAYGAVFQHGGMFKDKRPLFGRMTV